MSFRHVRIMKAGFETYTGPIGAVSFTDGVSDDPLTQRDVDRIAGVFQIELIDGNGVSLGQAGAAARLVGGATLPVPVLEPMARATEAQAEAEQNALKLEADVAPEIFTKEQLEHIASTGGIGAVREKAKPWNVRDRSIPNIIKEILKAQDTYLARRADAAAQVRAATLQAEIDRNAQMEAAIAATAEGARVLTEDTVVEVPAEKPVEVPPVITAPVVDPVAPPAEAVIAEPELDLDAPAPEPVPAAKTED